MKKIGLLLVFTMLASMMTVSSIGVAADSAVQTSRQLEKYDFENITATAAEINSNGKDKIAFGINTETKADAANLSIVDNPDGTGKVLKCAVTPTASEGSTMQLSFNFPDAAPESGETFITKFKYYVSANWGTYAYGSHHGTLYDVDYIGVTSGKNTGTVYFTGANAQAAGTGKWHEVTRIYDFDKKQYYEIIDQAYNETPVSFGSSYEGAGTSSAKHIKFGLYNKAKSGTEETLLYLDDVAAYRVKPQSLSSTIADTNVDLCQPMTINFQTPVNNVTAFANAVSIMNVTTGVEIPARRIITTLATDGMSVTIQVDGNDEWQSDTYKLAVSNTFRDVYGLVPVAAFEKSFTTVQKEEPAIELTRELEKYDFENITATAAEINSNGKDKIAFGINTETKADAANLSIVDNPDGTGKVLKCAVTPTASEGSTMQLSFNFPDAAPESGETFITKFKYYVSANWGTYAYGSHHGTLYDVDYIGVTSGKNTGTVYFTGANAQAAGTGKWHEVTRIYDFDKKQYYEIIDQAYNETPVSFGSSYEGAGTSSAKHIKFGLYNKAKSGTEETLLYLDDVAAYRVKPQQVKAMFDNVDVDINSAIKLQFGLPASDVQNLKTSLSIKDNTNNELLDAERISVDLADDKMSADISVAGGFDYNTNYTLTINKSFLDYYHREMTANYEKTFTTAYTSGVRVKSYLPMLTGNKLEVKVTISNPTAQNPNTWIVLASYTNDNYMIEVDTLTVDQIAAGSNEPEKKLTLNDISNADYVKLFLWDSSTHLQPYHMPVNVVY